ncbi:MAG: chalcone isomerase family protein [Burkholderiaceae bacterium]
MTQGSSRRAWLLTALVALAGASRAHAQVQTVPREVAANLADARLLGSGTLRFFGLHVYDARLWVGPHFDPVEPAASELALELEYRRDLKGQRIAERSLVEMQRGEPFGTEQGARWLAAMRNLFPDVRAGDRLSAINRRGEGIAFYLNGAPIGVLHDTGFARRFLAIWLGPHTSEPGLRRQLLGRNG